MGTCEYLRLIGGEWMLTYAEHAKFEDIYGNDGDKTGDDFKGVDYATS